MTEALLAIKDFFINEVKVKRFFGGCEINNIASKRVIEKCGLSHEGIIRSNLKLRDGYHDMYMFSYINKKH